MPNKFLRGRFVTRGASCRCSLGWPKFERGPRLTTICGDSKSMGSADDLWCVQSGRLDLLHYLFQLVFRLGSGAEKVRNPVRTLAPLGATHLSAVTFLLPVITLCTPAIRPFSVRMASLQQDGQSPILHITCLHWGLCVLSARCRELHACPLLSMTSAGADWSRLGSNIA
jgi:hypothetical protein